MPLYFFHLRDGRDELLDPEGTDLANLNAAAAAALDHARSIISQEALGGSIDLNQRIDVEDGQGNVIHSQPFHEAVAIRPSDKITRSQ